jgi:hypothetical protein
LLDSPHITGSAEPFVNHIVEVPREFSRCCRHGRGIFRGPMNKHFQGPNEQASFQSWPMNRAGGPPDDAEDDRERAVLYRQSAEHLRNLAAEVHFDFCRREQLLALAAGFHRLAARIEGSLRTTAPRAAD